MKVVWRRIYRGRTERSQIQSWGGPGVNSGVKVFGVSFGVNLNDFILLWVLYDVASTVGRKLEN